MPSHQEAGESLVHGAHQQERSTRTWKAEGWGLIPSRNERPLLSRLLNQDCFEVDGGVGHHHPSNSGSALSSSSVISINSSVRLKPASRQIHQSFSPCESGLVIFTHCIFTLTLPPLQASSRLGFPIFSIDETAQGPLSIPILHPRVDA
jgi:hypothetical protein